MGYVHFPKNFSVELTNLCNLRCSSCPRDIMTRDQLCIDFHLLEKIAGEIDNFGTNNVMLHQFGEPLLYPRIFDAIRLLKSKNNIRNVIFSTNCVLLNEKMGENIVKSGLDKIILAFDGTNKVEYEEIRVGAKYEAVLQNIENFISLARKSGVKKPEIVLSVIKTKKNENNINNFITHWNEKLSGIGYATYVEFTSFGGKVKESEYQTMQNNVLRKKLHRMPCAALWGSFTINSSGKVVACCYDINGEIELGDINKNSIYDVWHSENYVKIRKSHIKDNLTDYPMCIKCQNSVNISQYSKTVIKIVKEFVGIKI
ncbi:MAG: radical SAM protein [Candidatus Ancaeobacter aquaticus]|nr:radical SAM protein [Candidatus Ancaeobacter aquaticus]